MLEKTKFYLIICISSLSLGAIIVGLNVLFGNIYRIIKGKELVFNTTSSLIIFVIVFMICFGTLLKKGPSILKK